MTGNDNEVFILIVMHRTESDSFAFTQTYSQNVLNPCPAARAWWERKNGISLDRSFGLNCFPWHSLPKWRIPCGLFPLPRKPRNFPAFRPFLLNFWNKSTTPLYRKGETDRGMFWLWGCAGLNNRIPAESSSARRMSNFGNSFWDSKMKARILIFLNKTQTHHQIRVQDFGRHWIQVFACIHV